MPEIALSTATSLADLLMSTGLVPSKSELRRLVQQGGVRLDGNKVEDPNLIVDPASTSRSPDRPPQVSQSARNVISFESSAGALPCVLGWISVLVRHPSLFPVLVLEAVLVLSGCGQVITKTDPTPTVTPTTRPMAVATLRPTATPAPYTPAPTATPTLTPTPIIYVIRKGDTPLGIANEFGVSLRDLQDTNGITDPRTLRVGQELIIPEKAPPKDDSPTATPTPLPFVIENVTFSHTALGGLWGLGEIRNTSGMDLEQVALSAALLRRRRKHPRRGGSTSTA